MTRSADQWATPPNLPPDHYISSLVYSDQIFREEQEKIFNKSWIIACHESELPNAFDYRTFSHPGGSPLIIVRGEDMKVRSFYNICPHRGNTLALRSRGNAKTHDLHLSRVVVQREGRLHRHFARQAGVSGPVRLRTGPASGKSRPTSATADSSGSTWTTRPGSLAEFIGGAIRAPWRSIGSRPLEVFHYHRPIDQYQLQAVARHEQRVLPRLHALCQPDHGHDAARVLRSQVHRVSRTATASVGPMEIEYDAYEGWKDRVESELAGADTGRLASSTSSRE